MRSKSAKEKVSILTLKSANAMHTSDLEKADILASSLEDQCTPLKEPNLFFLKLQHFPCQRKLATMVCIPKPDWPIQLRADQPTPYLYGGFDVIFDKSGW